MMHYNLNLQREILPNTLVSVGYSGSRGIHLARLTDANLALPIQILGPNNPRFSLTPQCPNPNFETMDWMPTDTNSFYNALLLGVTRRLSQGLQFQASYTFSRNVAEADGVRTTTDMSLSAGTPTHPLFRGYDRGLSVYHVSHNFVSNWTYELPWGRQLTGAPKAFLGAGKSTEFSLSPAGFRSPWNRGPTQRRAFWATSVALISCRAKATTPCSGGRTGTTTRRSFRSPIRNCMEISAATR